MRYVYPCNIVRDEEEERLTGREAHAVTFPDVCGCNTCGWSWKEAVEMAIDALEVALGGCVDRGEDIPVPGLATDGQALIPVPPLAAAKLALYTAMREQGISEADLAARLQSSEATVHKIVSLDYRTRIRQVEIALLAVGRALAVEDVDLEADVRPALPELVGSEAGALR